MSDLKINQNTINDLREALNTSEGVSDELKNNLMDAVQKVDDKEHVAMLLSVLAISSPKISENEAFMRVCKELDINDVSIEANPFFDKILEQVGPEILEFIEKLPEDFLEKFQAEAYDVDDENNQEKKVG